MGHCMGSPMRLGEGCHGASHGAEGGVPMGLPMRVERGIPCRLREGSHAPPHGVSHGAEGGVPIWTCGVPWGLAEGSHGS